MEPVIELNGLTKYYGKARGIEKLSFTVEEGDFFGFIGPNGAGKSTTIRTLLGLVRPTSGVARVLRMDIAREMQRILPQVGYLPSESTFYAGMRVRDVLKLSASLRKVECGAEREALCSRLELDPGRKVEDLSFGNRKKVAIVCALQHKPPLLVLDEPTSGLDPLMQREFFSILHQRNEEGATVFLSSHVLSEVQRHCKTAAIIGHGTLVACDRVHTLIQTSAKRVIVMGQVKLDGLDGVRDIRTIPQGISFLYGGDPKLLIHWLGQQNLSDFTVTEPDLEEIVLHYYQKGGTSA